MGRDRAQPQPTPLTMKSGLLLDCWLVFLSFCLILLYFFADFLVESSSTGVMVNVGLVSIVVSLKCSKILLHFSDILFLC